MPQVGVEPTRFYPHASETCLSASSNTAANSINYTKYIGLVTHRPKGWTSVIVANETSCEVSPPKYLLRKFATLCKRKTLFGCADNWEDSKERHRQVYVPST